jgi:hypothetical protein
MTTPRASIPTNSSPIAVSWDSPPRRVANPMPAAMPPAATAAPAGPGRPSTTAMATPGSIPCAIASPRKAMPRSTTQVPVTAQSTATSSPPARARCMNSTDSGAVITHTGTYPNGNENDD